MNRRRPAGVMKGMWLLLLVLAQKEVEEYEPPTLTWLARHQRKDGLWPARDIHWVCGRHVRGSCESMPKLSREGSALTLEETTFLELCFRLCGSDVPAERDRGSAALIRFGYRAAPHLLARRDRIQDPEVQQRIDAAVREMPPPTEVDNASIVNTALSLIAMLEMGYSHLSKDTYAEICFGKVIKDGLQRLIRMQDEHGIMARLDRPDGMLAQILAAYALVEAYGVTGSMLIRPYAEPAYAATLRLQLQSGGWPRDADSGRPDPIATLFGLKLMGEAHVSEIADGPIANEPLFAFIEGLRGDDLLTRSMQVTASGLYGRKGRPGARERAEKLAALVENRSQWDALEWYAISSALFTFDGTQGALFNKFASEVKNDFFGAMNKAKGTCVYGGWPVRSDRDREFGRVWTTAVSSLTMTVHYRIAWRCKCGQHR